jgi:hypothetical protein
VASLTAVSLLMTFLAPVKLWRLHVVWKHSGVRGGNAPAGR